MKRRFTVLLKNKPHLYTFIRTIEAVNIDHALDTALETFDLEKIQVLAVGEEEGRLRRVKTETTITYKVDSAEWLPN